MIRRKGSTAESNHGAETPVDSQLSFDDFDLKLGDVMRGERATKGKSLLDVQRELRIQANYIAAIENCDPSGFESPGFIAGYVRSYARYLDLDPDEAFAQFCAESGFFVAHGMLDEASSIRKLNEPRIAKGTVKRDPFGEKNLAFAPKSETFLSKIEPAAIGSSLVLIALLGGVGYGSWSVLQEVQRVQVTPVDQTPQVLSDLAPVVVVDEDMPQELPGAGVFTPPRETALDRLYRPQALEVPVLVARDAPISSLDPNTTGLYAQHQGSRLPVLDENADSATRGLSANGGFSGFQQASFGLSDGGPSSPEVIANLPVRLFAADAVWVKVTDENGAVVASETLDSGTVWTAPKGDGALNVGTSRPYALFALVGDQVYGPIGQGVNWTSVPLNAAHLAEVLPKPHKGEDAALDRALVKAGAQIIAPKPVHTPDAQAPKVYADGAPAIEITTKRRVWMRVTSASGAVIKDFHLLPDETYTLPQMAQAPKLRVGDAGAVYFNVAGQTFGPMGNNGRPQNFDALSFSSLQKEFAPVDSREAQTSSLDTAVAEALSLKRPVPRSEP